MADELTPPSVDAGEPDPTGDAFFSDRGREAARDVDTALQLQGQSRRQRAIVNKTIYDATDNKQISRDDRRRAQAEMREYQRQYRIRFDWGAWRAERERRGDKTP